MIQTLMALWNRGARGRLLVMIVTFFCLCISISLLFVTVGSIWGSLLAHGGRPDSDPQKAVSNAVLITATAPPAVTPTLIVATPTLPPDSPCLASPTGAHRSTARSDETGINGRSGVPTRTPVSRPLRKTPTPGASILPTPSPTLPALTPTVSVTPTITPVATNAPTDTPTLAPTATSTPGASPTPTVMVTPTDTSTPGATPTTTATGTSIDTPTVTATGTTTPVTTATVMVTAPVSSPTTGMTGRQVHDGRPQVPVTPGDAANGQQSQGNCLSDALMTGGEASLLSHLQDFIWVILVSSLLGTALFCAQMYRLSRRTGR